MTPNLVSIVIICWNNWPDLELAIQSALCQSYPEVEVIVVDNGSTDATPTEVPKLFGGAVRYLRQPLVKCGAGYNAGIRLASGEFIQLLDGDDLLAPNKIGKQMDVFRADPDVDIVYGDFRKFQTLAEPAQWEDLDAREQTDMLRFLITSDGRIAPNSFLYRRRVMEQVGTWDENLYITDLDYWLRAAWTGCRFRYCPGSLCFSRKRPDQMTSHHFAMFQGVEAVWNKALGYITAESYRRAVAARLARCRFLIAINRNGMTIQEALVKLSEARAADPKKVNPLAFLMGALLILLPGAHQLVRASWLKPVRQWIGARMGLH